MRTSLRASFVLLAISSSSTQAGASQVALAGGVGEVVALSDGHQALAGGNDGLLSVLDLTTGALKREFHPEPINRFRSSAASADSGVIAAVNSNNHQDGERYDGERLATVRGTAQLVVQYSGVSGKLVAFNREGTVMATLNRAGEDSTVIVVDVRTRRLLRVINVDGTFFRIALSPNGEHVALGADGDSSLHFYNARTGAAESFTNPQMSNASENPSGITEGVKGVKDYRYFAGPSMVFSQDSSELWWSPHNGRTNEEQDATDMIYSVKIGGPAPHSIPRAHVDGHQELIGNPANNTAALIGSRFTELLDMNTGRLGARVEHKFGHRATWAFNRDGTRLMGVSAEAKKVTIFDGLTLEVLHELDTLKKATGIGARVATSTSAEDEFLVFGADVLQRVDARTGKVVSTVPWPTLEGDNSAPVAASGAGEIEYQQGIGRDTSTGASLGFGGEGGLSTPRMAINRHGRVLMAMSDGSITRVIDLASTKVVRRVHGTLRALSPKGRWLVAGDAVVDLESGQSRALPAGSVSFSPSERWLTLGDKAMDLSDVASVAPPAPVRLFVCKFAADESRFACSEPGERAATTTVRTLPPDADNPGVGLSGEVLAVSSRRVAVLTSNPTTVSVHDASTGAHVWHHEGGTRRVAFTRAGDFIIAARYEELFRLDATATEARSLKSAVKPCDRNASGSEVCVISDEDALSTIAVDPSDRVIILGTTTGEVILRALDDNRELAVLKAETSEVRNVIFGADPGRFWTDTLTSVRWQSNGDPTSALIDVADATIVARLATYGGEPLIVTPDGFFTGPPNAAMAIAVRVGLHAYPLVQFDAALNRPDIVLARLARVPPPVQARLDRARQQRAARLGLDRTVVEGPFTLAEVSLKRPPMQTTSPTVELQYDIIAGDGRPIAIQVVVNGVPLHSGAGVPLTSTSGLLSVPLGAGVNRVRVTVLDDKGGESVVREVRVEYRAPKKKPDLYVLAVGVSAYQDARFALQYAAKDATDLVGALAKGRRYGKVHAKLIVDGDVSRESVIATRAFLEQARVDDVVMVFIAGHGMVDASANYWYATADFDFTNPASRGMSFDDLEGLVSGLTSRSKVMFIDTCAAGETDEDEVERASRAPLAGGVKVATRGFNLPGRTTPPIAPEDELVLTRNLFASLRRGSGTHVIGSSAGVEVAFESELVKNGIFTRALLDELARKVAKKEDPDISVSTLRQRITNRVEEATGGLQHPIARESNADGDFVVWSAPGG